MLSLLPKSVLGSASPASRRSSLLLTSSSSSHARLASTVVGPSSPSAAFAEKQAMDQGQSAPEDMQALRLKAIRLYKELHRLGRDYPDPEYHFNKRLRRAYEKNAKETDPKVLQEKLAHAEHIKKEILAMISLKKFRHLRRSYHAHEGPR